jgi:hypothetical protein
MRRERKGPSAREVRQAETEVVPFGTPLSAAVER